MAEFIYRVGQGDPVKIFTDGETPPITERRIAYSRAKRNLMLANSDSMIVTDRGMSESKNTEWKTYRQELRDMDFSDPHNLTWPTKSTEES